MPERTQAVRLRYACARDRRCDSTEKTHLKVTLKPTEKTTSRSQHASQMGEQLREGLGRLAQRWRADRTQLGTQVRLGLAQAPPESIATGQRQRTDCHPFPGRFARCARYNGHRELQKRAGSHHTSGQHVVEQNRECSAAAWAQEAIGTIKPTSPNDALLAPLRITLDPTMPNESTCELAVRTCEQLGLMKVIIQCFLAAHETNRRTPNHDPLTPDRRPVPRWADRAKRLPNVRPKSLPVRNRIAAAAELPSHSVNSVSCDRSLRRESGF
jgi:hypothetical protein